ncbi:MipA/OmpV family protein [Motilimonas eburnea]|uniref:MipA/OmpV family protein n=1 Tax=Motilimonas eburnea TaxID=1737488 RepID=UPI001E31AB89|nr:MipA/OmpV family protein [Motilimonas eburnea]
MRGYTALLFIASLISSFSFAASDYADSPLEWGVAIGLRHADVPFYANDKYVDDVVPLLFYHGERLFLDGVTASYELYQGESLYAGVMGKFRFFDIPRDFQNQINGTGFDMGGMVGINLVPHWKAQLEVLTDEHSRYYANLYTQYHFTHSHWDLSPYFNLRVKGERFNDYYYGLKQYQLGSGIDLKVGTKGRLHLYKNLYLLGDLAVTRLDSNSYHSEHIRSVSQMESYIGIGLFNPPSQSQSYLPSLPKGYIRFAHGWGTPSNIGEIFSFNREKDPYNNSLTSVFYGHPLASKLFDFPFDIYLTSGLIRHNSPLWQDSCHYLKFNQLGR